MTVQIQVVCQNCWARYGIDPSEIPATGREVQCSGCGYVWHQWPKPEAESPPDAKNDAMAVSPIANSIGSGLGRGTDDDGALDDTRDLARLDGVDVDTGEPVTSDAQPAGSPSIVSDDVIRIFKEEAEFTAEQRELNKRAEAATDKTDGPLSNHDEPGKSMSPPLQFQCSHGRSIECDHFFRGVARTRHSRRSAPYCGTGLRIFVLLHQVIRDWGIGTVGPGAFGRVRFVGGHNPNGNRKLVRQLGKI